MNIYNQNNTSSLPTSIVYQPSCLTSMPMSAETDDSWGNSGSGIGGGSEAIRSALGEYFERRHFYMEVMPDMKGTLDFSMSIAESKSFCAALFQTCENNKALDEVRNHEFQLSEVYRASNFSRCYVPTACLSLSAHKIENDSTIYPLRDTCGCSFHWNPMTAIFGSLKEQLERQFLTKFWLTKGCRIIISSSMAKSKLKNTHSATLYQYLTLAGETTVIDISDPSFPGVCVLIVYGSAAADRHVKYCAGMAYAASLEEALDKSIRELWQTFRFIDLFKATNSEHEKIEDPYLRHFLSCNNYQTYTEITEILQSYELTPNHEERFDAPGLLKTLENCSISGFIYIKPITIENSNYFASKYFSPDLFLHMNNSQNINIRNRYSDSFFHNIDDARKNAMVPFP